MIRHLIQLWTARPFRNAYLLRGVLAWWVLRFAAAYAGIGMGQLLPALFMVSMSGAIVWIDARRRNEDLFLGNLGIPTSAIWILGLAPAVVLEGSIPLAFLR